MSLRVAAVAVNQTPLDWQGNYAHLVEGLTVARNAGATIICFPELAISSYGCEDLFCNPDILERCWQLLQRLLPHGAGVLFTVGLPLRYKGKCYNVLAIVDSGCIVGFYAKQLLAKKDLYYEPRWFEAWPSEKIASFERDGLTCPIGEVMHTYETQRIGFEICEDMWHDDRPAARYKAAGVDIILSAHASHFSLGKRLVRAQLLKESSAKYGCLFVYANMLGNDAGRVLYGGELLMAQAGELVATAPKLSFSTVNVLTHQLTAIISPSCQADSGESEEEAFTQAATLSLFDYLRKSHARGFVLSASGGADSSMCALLVHEMLHRVLCAHGISGCRAIFPHLPLLDEGTSIEEAVRTYCARLLTMVYQASAHSSTATFQVAQELAHTLSATFLHWSIDEEVKSYTDKVEKALGRTLSWEQDDTALQNVQARARTPALWLLANVQQALLLTTGNRSEASVGYTTMDGDTAGSLAPLASVSKCFILKWLRWMEKKHPCNALRAINTSQPTAELRPASAAQADEKDLMPYSLLQAIEYKAIYCKHSPAEVLTALNKENVVPYDVLKEYVSKFFRLFAQNQWKRERYAPSLHLSTYSVDPKTWYRFPILSAGYAEELAEL